MTISEKYSLQQEGPSHRWWSSPLVREKVGMGKIRGEREEAHVSNFDKIPQISMFCLISRGDLFYQAQSMFVFVGKWICIFQASLLYFAGPVYLHWLNCHDWVDEYPQVLPTDSWSIRVSGFHSKMHRRMTPQVTYMCHQTWALVHEISNHHQYIWLSKVFFLQQMLLSYIVRQAV